MKRTIARLAAAGAVLVFLAFAGRAALRTLQAQRLVEAMTRESLEQALRLAPGDSNAWGRLGALLEQQGEAPEAAGRALERAVALNPYNVPALLDLGLHYEFQGDSDRALSALQKANRFSRSYATRWALANFYLRQGDRDRFWAAIREAIQLTREDLTPAFELCWRAGADHHEIVERALPNDPEVFRRYFAFLATREQPEAAAVIWKRLENQLQPQDLEPGLQYVESLLNARRLPPALDAWNRLCASRLLACEPLQPARGNVVSNGSFALVPSALGFDWRLPRIDGLDTDVLIEQGEASFRARFSGAHPEEAVLMWQWAPVEPQRSYRLGCRYLTQGLPRSTGVQWTVRDETAAGRSVELPAAGRCGRWKKTGAVRKPSSAPVPEPAWCG